MSALFSSQSLALLRGLRENNNRQWYQENKEAVELDLLAPARALVLAVGAILGPKFPGLVADPRTDRSIYRLYRDTRFARDKRPYKDWLALTWYLDSPHGRLEAPCFYFHLTPDSYLWSVGCYRFAPPALERWPAFLADPKKGRRLEKALTQLQDLGLQLNEPNLKRLPPGTDPTAPWAQWLRYRGLYTWSTPCPPPEEIFTAKAGSFLADLFLTGQPLFDCLVDLYEGLLLTSPGCDPQTRNSQAKRPPTGLPPTKLPRTGRPRSRARG
ncbi:MAG: DUF2461 domain-containing protein [Deltaproteobacteria bacterium]|nr:DUF2461 domain-containing protein [Deltaproteobacteria bacterium]